MIFFKDKFKNIRKEKRYTIKQLASDIGVTRATVWNWENGKRTPNETMIRKLAATLSVKTDELSDIIPENEFSKELLQKPIQSFILNADPGQQIRKNKYVELLGIINYFNSSLEQSSTIINAILDSMYSMCYIKDTNLKYIAANKSYLTNLNVSDHFAILGTKDEDLLSKKEAAINTKQDKEVLSTKTPIIGKECFIPNSQKKKIGLSTKQPIFDHNGNVLGVVCIIVDITKIRAEEAERIMLEKIIESINTGICIYNISKNKVIYKNKAHDSNFLPKENSVLNEEIINSDDFIQFQKYLAIKAFPPSFDCRVIHDAIKNRAKLYSINHSKVKYKNEDYFVFFENDITDIRKSQDINSIVNESLDAIKLAFCIVDYNSKKLVYTNGYREKIYGYPLSTFLDLGGKFWLENCIHPDDRKTQKLHEDRSDWPEIRQFRIIRPNREVRWIEARSVNNKFTFNGRKCIAFFDRDITEERELKKLNELFAAALDMVSDGVLIYEENRVGCIFANKAIKEKTGYCEKDFSEKEKNIFGEKYLKVTDGIHEINTINGNTFEVDVFSEKKTIYGRFFTIITLKFKNENSIYNKM